MKPIIDRKTTTVRVAAASMLAFVGLMALATATTFADRGRGSIRADARPAARPEPARAAPARAQPEVRHDVRPAPEVRHDVPEVRHDVRPEPARAEPVRRDWDAGDEDGRHYGGFAHPVPDRVFRGARVRG